MMWLVTGATGFVGNNVVRLLVDRGQRVRVLVRDSTLPPALEGLPVEIARGDVCEAASLKSALRGVQRVIHAAAVVHIGWKKLKLQRTVNVEGTRNVAEAARNARARLVYVSSIDALGVTSIGQAVDEATTTDFPVLCPYVVTKREAESVVLEGIDSGLDAIIVNPGFMLGPWDWKPSSGQMLLEVAKGWALLAPPGSNSYCDVRDVAAAIVTAAERDHAARRYILAGESLSYREAWNIFAHITGGRRAIRTARRGPLRMIGRIGDAYGRFRNREGKINSAAVEMSMLRKNYSSAKAVRELGYCSRSMEESATDAWIWLQRHGYVKGPREGKAIPAVNGGA